MRIMILGMSVPTVSADIHSFSSAYALVKLAAASLGMCRFC